MSFQIYFRDMRHGGERTSVCVADSLEEFRNTTVEELKRKLIPEDQLKDTILRYRFKTLQENRTLGFYDIKHEDHIYAVRHRIPVIVKHPRDSSPVHESAAKNIKLDNYDLKPLEDDHTLGSGIKHEDESSSVETASSGTSGSLIYLSSSSSEQNHIYERSSAETGRSGKHCIVCPSESFTGTITVYVDSEELKNMTVKEFIKRLDLPGPCDDYRLIFKDRHLQNHKTLRDYGIKHESTVFRIDSRPIRPIRVGGATSDEEDKGTPRTQSMDNLLFDMHQPSCCVM